MKRVLLACAIVAAIGGRAHACPEHSSWSVAGEGDRRPTPVRTPLVILSGGASTDGWSGELALGWAWGERDVGWLFPSTKVRRVLVHARRPLSASNDPADRAWPVVPRLALTYGWYETSKKLLDAGLDLGVTAARGEIGPIAQLTLGVGGFGVRLTGGAEFGREMQLVAAIEFVADLATWARRL